MLKVRIRIFVQRIQVNDFVAVVYIQSHLIIKCLSLVTRKSVFEWSIRPAGRTILACQSAVARSVRSKQNRDRARFARCKFLKRTAFQMREDD